MGVMGKIVGGTIGFALGGPLGAIAGAAFGHVFDKSDVEYVEYRKDPMSAGESSQFTFYVAAFSMLAKLAKADGRLDPSELDAVRRFMAKDLNLDPFGRKIAEDIFSAALNSNDRFEDFANQFYREFRAQPQLLELMADILFKVASADGTLNETESRMIRTAMTLFHLDETVHQGLLRKYGGLNDKAYAVLKSIRTDSDDQIKTNYRKLVGDYHPDKIASKGLPDEFNKFAHDKFIEIQNAYEEIKKDRGMA
ncbi:MAG: molecular chaperone DjlA [Desulfobacteraceae bacterium]|nr:molecular chaperone DjlA [Desulfobacteraceae bacterium]MBU4055921.1 TerB family tellurite resistance protein [Pseudomonadota bacterium]